MGCCGEKRRRLKATRGALPAKRTTAKQMAGQADEAPEAPRAKPKPVKTGKA